MKVLIVGALKPTGRLLPFVHEQAEALQAAGLEVDYFAITGKGIIGYLRCRKPLMQKIRKFLPDVIHAHFGLSGLLANLQRRVPVVTTYHGSDINVPSVLRFSKIAMRLSKFNIFVSQKNIDIALGTKNKKQTGKALTKNNYTLLPCGVDVDNFNSRTREEARRTLGWGMEEKKVLFAGAFDNVVKNAELAKQAIAYLNEKDYEKHELSKHYPICVDSSIPSQASLDGLNEQLNNVSNESLHPNTLGDNDTNVCVELVEMKGYSRAEVANLFYAADALVMTSFTEGSPQVVKEAMACGCPIVSVDVGDVAERIAGVDKCYIAERTPEDIALKLNTIIQDTQRTNGREHVLAMGLDNKQVAEKLIEIYREICK